MKENICCIVHTLIQTALSILIFFCVNCGDISESSNELFWSNVVRNPSVRKLFTFSSSDHCPSFNKTWRRKHLWLKRDSSLFQWKAMPLPFQREDNNEKAKIHWRNLKCFYQDSLYWASFNQIWHDAFGKFCQIIKKTIEFLKRR